jgi:hypothetical protein
MTFWEFFDDFDSACRIRYSITLTEDNTSKNFFIIINIVNP